MAIIGNRHRSGTSKGPGGWPARARLGRTESGDSGRVDAVRGLRRASHWTRIVTQQEPIVASETVFESDLDARFRRLLMSFFLRRTQNDSALAQDLTQETLLRVIVAHRASRIERPEGYIFAVAANLLRDQHRLRARFGSRVVVPVDDATAGELERELVEDLSPERVVLGEESLDGVLRTLEELGERTRDIFILFRLERMKQKDIAALYGIGQSTVEKHVMRAVLHLVHRYGVRTKP